MRAALCAGPRIQCAMGGTCPRRVDRVFAGGAGRHCRPDAPHGSYWQPIEAFFEVPLDADLHERLDAISSAGAAAKVRTGGTTPAAIPSPTALADFLYECAQRRLPFKATAGLHHAVRSCYALTYERDSATAVMHGLQTALRHDPAATRRFFRSFGSCSFREPAEALARIADLKVGTTTTA